MLITQALQNVRVLFVFPFPKAFSSTLIVFDAKRLKRYNSLLASTYLENKSVSEIALRQGMSSSNNYHDL